MRRAVPESPEVIRMRFLEAQKHGEIRLLTPLPRRVRFRFRLQRLVDAIGIWLVERRRFRLAEWLWRL